MQHPQKAVHDWVQKAEQGPGFGPNHGNRNSVKHVFREVKRRIPSSSNSISHAEPEIAEKLLQSFARWHNAHN